MDIARRQAELDKQLKVWRRQLEPPSWPILVETLAKAVVSKLTVEAGRSPAWFWSEAWQRGEAEASRDIKAGRVKTYESDDEFLHSLDS